MSGVKINNIVKRSISLSPLVNQWAEEMASKRGFGTNFSAFLADLVRRAQESDGVNSAQAPAHLAEAIVSGAVAATSATPPVAPVSYGSKRKAPRRKATSPASAPRKKAL